MPLGTEVGLGPGGIVRWGLSSPTERGTAPPHFSAGFALARLPISATAELLLPIPAHVFEGYRKTFALGWP